jgi:hypothetical protein
MCFSVMVICGAAFAGAAFLTGAAAFLRGAAALPAGAAAFLDAGAALFADFRPLHGATASLISPAADRGRGHWQFAAVDVEYDYSASRLADATHGVCPPPP